MLTVKSVKISVEKQILKAIEEYINYFLNYFKTISKYKSCPNGRADDLKWNEKYLYYWGEVGTKSESTVRK